MTTTRCTLAIALMAITVTAIAEDKPKLFYEGVEKIGQILGEGVLDR